MSKGRTTAILAMVLLCVTAGAAVASGATSEHLSIEASGEDAEVGGTTTVTVTLSNNGDTPSGAIVEVSSLPDGWEVVNHSDDGGSWNGEENKWLFQQVGVDKSVEPTVTLSVPEDASSEAEIEVRATDGDGEVTATATVSVEGGSSDADESSDSDGDDSGGLGGMPGFGVGVTLVALLGAALLALRR